MNDSGGIILFILAAIIELGIAVFMIATFWKLFSKAGEPGWAAIIPIYQIIVWIKISGKPVWWFLLLCIPPVTIVIYILVTIEIAKKFGKSTGYGILLLFFPYILYPILAFGSAKYQEQQ